MCAQQASERVGELGSRRTDRREAQRGERPVVDTDVREVRAEGDEGGAAGNRLERSHAAGGVHHDIGRAQQVAHAAGVAEHAEALLPREASREARTQLLVASADAHHVRAIERDGGADSALEVADAPSAAGDDDQRSLLGQLEFGTQTRAIDALEKLRSDQWSDDASATRTGDPLDRAQAHLVTNEVQVDAAVRPDLPVGEVGDRRANRHLETSPAPHLAERGGQRGMGRNHDLRALLGNERRKASATEQVEQPRAERTGPRHVHEQRVEDRERPRCVPQLHAVALADDERCDPPEAAQTVAVYEVRPAPRLRLGDQGTCAREVTLADIRRQHQRRTALGRGGWLSASIAHFAGRQPPAARWFRTGCGWACVRRTACPQATDAS